MARTIVIGDVHGCRAELDALLDKLAFAMGDRLVFVGDTVARGPDSLGVLDIVRRTGAILVRGNHEQKLLQGRNEPTSLGKMHAALAQSLRPTDWSLFETSKFSLDLPEHELRVVHAGVVPGRAFADQTPQTLMTIRCVTVRGEASDDKVPVRGARLWGELYEGSPHVVFGHNAQRDPQLHRWATGIDTACVYGGHLAALVLGPGEAVPRGEKVREILVMQPAFGMHYDWQRSPKKGARG